MLKEIHTISQLEREKEKLQIKLDITRDAFVESLGNNRKQLHRFLLENVAIPAGILGLGKIAIKQFTQDDEQVFNADEQKNQKEENKKHIFNTLFKILFPVALNIFQAFLLKKQDEKKQEYLSDEIDELDGTIEKSITPPLKSVS